MGSIRQGLPHLYSTLTPKGNLTPSLSVEQFQKLTAGGKVFLHNVTEKTDGITFLLGWDYWGFYTKHSGSGDDKARVSSDHFMRAVKRSKETGCDYDPKFPQSIAHVHKAIQFNQRISEDLRDLYKRNGVCEIRGELLNRTLGKRVLFTREMKFVHTRYSTRNMGTLGTFILHSQLDENKELDTDRVLEWSDKYLTFDHDKVSFTPCAINVEREVELFNQLNHSLIMGRATPKTKAAKVAENEAFNQIKKSVSEKVAGSLTTLGVKNKWGSGSEGLVVHASSSNPEAPRFKITTREFQEAKVNARRF